MRSRTESDYTQADIADKEAHGRTSGQACEGRIHSRLQRTHDVCRFVAPPASEALAIPALRPLDAGRRVTAAAFEFVEDGV